MPGKVHKGQTIDYTLLLVIFTLVVLGVLAVSSASVVISFDRFGHNFYYLRTQLIATVLGLIAMSITTAIDYRYWRKMAYPLMLVTVGLLVAVLIPGIGRELGGARAWIYLGPINFQPAEIVKLTFLLYFAAWLERQGEGVRQLHGGFIPFLTMMGVIAFLVMMQPDLGTLTIIVTIAVAMFFAAGASWFQIGAISAGAVGFFLLLIKVAPYRLQRLLTFLEPTKDCLGAGYQICQSMLGIGTGGWWGLGFGQSKQKFLYLPQAHTDSIFVIIAEELGFIRTFLFLCLFGLIGYRGYKIAEQAPDMFGRLVATGITTWFIFQTFVNIGAALSIMPLTGVTLPFVSYGGSSMILTLAAAGILLNISKHAKRES